MVVECGDSIFCAEKHNFIIKSMNYMEAYNGGINAIWFGQKSN